MTKNAIFPLEKTLNSETNEGSSEKKLALEAKNQAMIKLKREVRAQRLSLLLEKEKIN